MEKTNVKYGAYVQILKEELLPAMGCTEPIALAYAAATARKVLGELPDRVVVGASGSIIKKHLLTNCIGTLIVTTTLQIPSSIFTESFLSFLGLGVNAPMPSLGSLASAALNGLQSYPYRLFAPALMISIIILSFNLLGDGLRDAFDPKLKN